MFNKQSTSPSFSLQSTLQPSPIAKMFKLVIVMAAVLAGSSASPLGFGLGAPLLSKVSYAAPEVTKTIQPEVTVQQHEYQYKSVPVAVPVAAPYQAEPIITHYNLPPTYSYEAFRGYPAFGYPHAYSHFAPAAAAVIEA